MSAAAVRTRCLRFYRTTYNVACLELEEGRAMSGVVDVDRSELRCDMPLEVAFRVVSDEMTLPKFRPAK